MFLAAGKLGPGRNDMLMPMLASQGKSVVPKCVHLLTGNPDASLDIAVRVTRIVGNEAIPTLIEQYSGSAAVLVRHYIVFSVKEILTKPGRKKPNADGLLQWAIGLSDEKDDAVAAIALRIMHALLTKDNAVNIEPVLKAKLDDPRLAVRIAATDILTQVCPKADYVMKHVLASSLTTKELMDREMSIRCCARLPESEDTLNVIYECAFDKNERVRAVAQQTLASMGSRTLPLASKMLKKLQEGNTDSLPAILTVLKNSKERWSEIEDAVVKYLSNGNPRIRGFCLDFLANHPLRDETVRKMIELLADTDKQVRISALRSLHTFRQKTFVTSAILDRKTKETDAGVKKLLDSFSSEISATTEPH
jgi:HEAT repeat protein